MASIYDTIMRQQQPYSAKGPVALSPAEHETFYHLDGFPRYQAQTQAQSDPSSQSGLPPGFSQMLDKLSNNAGRSNSGTIVNAQPNSAGSVATDSGSFAPTVATDSGAFGGGATDAEIANWSSYGGAQAGTEGAASGLDSLGGASAGSGGGAAGGGSMLGSLGPIAAIAAAVGLGKNTEANHAGTPLGDGLLAGLAPSVAQMWKDPVGMGLPTLLGVPFITPFTGSDDAKKTKPEWSGLFGLGF